MPCRQVRPGKRQYDERRGCHVDDITEKVIDERLRRRVAFGPSGHIELAEKHHSSAVAKFQQRAVLQAVTAIQDRQKITAKPVSRSAPTPRYLDCRSATIAAQECRTS